MIGAALGLAGGLLGRSGGGLLGKGIKKVWNGFLKPTLGGLLHTGKGIAKNAARDFID